MNSVACIYQHFEACAVWATPKTFTVTKPGSIISIRLKATLRCLLVKHFMRTSKNFCWERWRTEKLLAIFKIFWAKHFFTVNLLPSFHDMVATRFTSRSDKKQNIRFTNLGMVSKPLSP